MSKTIKIKRGAVDATFAGVYYVEAHRNNGDSADWVPDDETQCTTIEITSNGVYKASDLGVYGWHTVSVHVPKEQQVIGYDSDGDLSRVTRDSESGEIVRTKVPFAIGVATSPTKTTYDPGETLNYSGLVVSLLNPDNTVFTDSTYTTGVVPDAQLAKPTVKAPTTPGQHKIPVYWTNVYTGRVLRAGITITVVEHEESEGE